MSKLREDGRLGCVLGRVAHGGKGGYPDGQNSNKSNDCDQQKVIEVPACSRGKEMGRRGGRFL
jgi:hypothetical protein